MSLRRDQCAGAHSPMIAARSARRAIHSFPKRVSKATAPSMSGARASDHPPAMSAATPANQPMADSSAPNSSATPAKWIARATTISASTRRPSWFDLEVEAAFGAVGVDREHLPVHLVAAGRKAAHRDDDL